MSRRKFTPPKAAADDTAAPETADAETVGGPDIVIIPGRTPDIRNFYGEPEKILTPAESFAAWWNATIPNSPVSRNTTLYNRAYALKTQLLSVLSEA